MHPIVAVVLLVVIVGAVGYWLVSFVRNPYASMGRGKAGSAAGGVLTDLDRLLARPSVEHKIETKNKIQDRDDAIGGE